MMSFERKAKDYYGEVVINKGLMRKAGFGARAIPVYVGEWIISQFMDGDELTLDGRNEIVNTVSKYLPQKADKNTILNRLMEQEEVRILDDSAFRCWMSVTGWCKRILSTIILCS